ncbi:Starch-binding associating with outer membrane [Lutibacter oricola]|uniref:Starch-binding associating with outer membrane n=1 Tax=Lutibacter oricola TaxID=762486 RepID=A0A1H3FH05_9FLAO|nr:RagB/SusD family nutrient uptake outer membrane protein [Lutibacter oricola]SDX90413.1 Starch-binding associating with outer membrane [Lutibacter oricola]
MKNIHKKTTKYKLMTHKTFLKGLLPLIVLALSFQACVDELDQVNPNALTLDTFWQNAGDLNGGLNATYASLRDENILGIKWEYNRTDIAVPSVFRNKSTGTAIYDQTFDLTTNEVQNKWNACFKGIFRANQVIDAYYRLEDTFNGADAEQSGIYILAQARALRGYFYYVLHNSFNKGSLPIFETVPVEIADFQKSFSTSEDVKAFYLADLEYGKENLPGTYNAWQSEAGNGNLGRITGGFCEGLIAKTYINENDFVNAEIYLKNVIDNYGYELADDLAKCFTGIAEFNNESIFEINYSYDANPLGLDEQKLSQQISHQLNDGNQVQFSSWLTLKYRAEKPDPLNPINLVNRNIYDTSGNLDSIQENVVRMYSLRMNNSMTSVDDRDGRMYGVENAEYGTEKSAATHGRQTPNFIKKFTGWNTENGGLGEDESADKDNRSDINIPIMRLGEIYLLYAECMIEKGDLSEALRYINRIRKRSGLILLGKSTETSAEFVGSTTTYMDDIDMDPSNGEQSVTLENLENHLRFTEKPLELSLEGDRAYDLRRWGVWKQQLENLSTFEYDSWHFRNNRMGKNPTRWRCFIMPTGVLPTYDDPNLPDYAFRQVKSTPEAHFINGNRRAKEPHLRDALTGSKNFIEDIHAYLPVPQDELNSNLNWNQ